MKIFCIGLNKTGTTTFGRVMRDLGYLHFSKQRAQLMNFLEKGLLEKIFDVIDPHDSFDDWPYFAMYVELAKKYPNAKFVLTMRSSPEKWVNSMKRHSLFTKSSLAFLEKRSSDFSTNYYGAKTPFGNEDLYAARYLDQIANVTSFFEENGRSKDLMKICWEDEADTSALSKFLGLPASKTIHIPHTNKGSTWSNWRINGYEQHFENNVTDIKEHLVSRGISAADTGLTEMVDQIHIEYQTLNR